MRRNVINDVRLFAGFLVDHREAVATQEFVLLAVATPFGRRVFFAHVAGWNNCGGRKLPTVAVASICVFGLKACVRVEGACSG
jgi:hypothetical protein